MKIYVLVEIKGNIKVHDENPVHFVTALSKYFKLHFVPKVLEWMDGRPAMKTDVGRHQDTCKHG